MNEHMTENSTEPMVEEAVAETVNEALEDAAVETASLPKARKPFWKNPTLLLVLAVLLAAGGIYAAFYFNAPMPETAPANMGAELTAPGYVYIIAGEEGRWFPLAEEEPVYLTLERGDMKNVIKISPDSVCMDSSTCDNQDCVMQGVVSLANKEERVLRNLIVCLPNSVGIELYTTEEILQSMEANQ